MQITAQSRNILGKNTKKLRRNQQIPAVIYSSDLTSTPVLIEKKEFVKIYSVAGETDLIDLVIDGKSERVLIKDVQNHPVSSQPIHVGFFKVNLKEKIKADVPIEVTGEKENPLLKTGEGLLLILLNEIEVEALPADLPHSFIVNVSNLIEVEQGVAVNQLDYDREKIEILNTKPDELVVKMSHAKMAEEEAEGVVDETAAVESVEATKELSEEEKATREAEKKTQ